MSIRYLDLSGAVNFWTNIKNYILSKIPTKTSELTNDSGFLTQHQSLSNYVTLNSEQTITGKKLFTNSTTKVNSVNTFIGSTLFIDTSASVPRGSFPESACRVGRIYIGDGTSYNGSWFIIDPIIDTNKAYYRMVTTNPDNTDSTRFSITWDSTETGARCRKNVSTGDLLPYANNTYNLGSDNRKWDIGYIHNLIGSNKEDLTEDANNYYSTTSGSHMTFYTTSNGGTKLSNVPAAVNTHLESRTIRYLSSSDWIIEQICHNSFGLYYRKGTNGTWEDWKTFAFTNSNITGTASNVTGTVAIANGGTGATSRLSAIKNLTNESVGTPTHFLGLTTNYAKCGYTSIAQAKTVLGITGDMGSHSDSEYVHKTGDESIIGTKTFGNGTLIVDNGTGNNVHGEIKLNGTRPVYINADNSEDGLFANTACGMSIILNDSSKSIHIGGYTTNSSGRKLIKTADKAPYLTLGTQEVGTQILVPENDTADSAFSITSTLKYASGASAKSFTVKFKQGDDGSSGVFPVANNKTDLGLSGNRWKSVYATNYYYGADAVEFSTKFVTSDTTQTISGAKTFSSTITGNISGNASTATEFSANKSVTLTGDVTGTASSKAGWSVSTTLSNSGVTAGTYGPSEDVTGNNNATISVPEITVDSKGRVTSVTNRTLTCKNNTYNVYNKTLTIQKNGTNVATFTSNSNTNVTANITVPTKTSELTNDSNFLTTSSSLNASKLTGTIDIARLPQGALERVITVANQTARFALTTSSVQLGDTVKQLDTGVMYVVVNESKLNSNDGYLEYTAGSASSVPWSGITSKPTEFTPSSHTHTKSEITDFPTNVSAFTNDSGYLTSHQSLSNYVTLNTAQEITSAKTFKDTSTVRKLTSVEAGNVIPSSDKLISDIWQDKNGKELGRIYYSKTKGGNTALIMRAGDWFSESEGVYSLNASGTNRRAELHLYSDSSGNCCIKPVGLFSTHIKPLNSSVYLGDSTKPFGRVYANAFEFCNAGLLPDTDVQTAEEHSIGFYGQNNTPLSYITFQKRPNLKDRIAVRVQTAVSAYKSYCFDATCFYPEASNNLDIGSTTNIFKNIYCNNYYKGTTAFGDIVTHNASEFLTSHQSLSNYVTLDGTQTIAGTKTFSSTISGSISGNAGTATQFSANTTVALTGDATGTSAGSKKGWSVPVTLANSGVTAGTYGPSADVTGSNNATILVPEITVDAKGRVTSVTNRTYTSVNTDTNTDTKVTQTVTNDNACYPLLIANTASASHTGLEPTTETDEVRKAYNINVHARYGFIYARNSYNHDNLKGSVAGGNRTSAAFYGSTYDGAIVGGVELGRVDKYGNRYSRLYATNYITDGALAPDGTAVATTFDVGVLADGTKYLNTIAGWYCNVYPTANNTRTLGTSSLRWKECYSNAYYLGTTAFGDIVTHNASEFLTSHQSLSSCVKNNVTNNQTIKSTGITRGTAPSSAQTFGIAFSDNNNKYIGNIYGQYATDKSTYVGLYAYKGSTTSNGDNAYVRVGYDASGNVYTSAPTPATTDNSTQIATTAFVKAQGYLTSHQSLANYVTTNTDQSISGIKSYSKHISILGDYVGNEASTNGRSCLYLKANRDTDGKSGLYVTKFRQNVAQGSMGSSDVVFLSHDILENETRTNAGFVESYSNWTNDVPGGMSIYSSIATRNLGTSAKPWTNAYITNLNLNGSAFNPASVSGNIGDVVFASAYYSAIMGTADLDLTVSGDALFLAGFDNNTLNVDSTPSSLAGTWKFLGIGKPTTTSGNADTKRVGLWKRIA